jgi:ceramide glucosyltransferase
MLLYALAAFGIAVQLAGLAAFVGFALFKRPDPSRLTELPGVTILKPCYGIEDSEALNYHGFFTQDYGGPIQLLFVASRETDPAVGLVREFLARYPHVDAELVISTTRNSYWGKIDAVYDGMKRAKHDHLVISDSDVRVEPTYVKEMVAALQEPGISLVSSPQFDYGANTIGSGLKIANNCDTAALMVGYYAIMPVKKLSLGHSIGFRLSEFNTLGEDRWDVINTYLAEDMAYAYLFTRAGKRAVLRNIFCPVSFSNKTVRQTHAQKVRWLLNQKMVMPNRAVYLSGLLLYPELAALATLDARMFLAACATRVLVSFVTEAVYFRQIWASLRYWWLVPLWDLAQPYYFALGFFKTTIRYGDKEYRVVNHSFLEEIAPPAGEARASVDK